MRLGAHLSIAGGVFRAVESAKKIGARTLQIFSSPPRNWREPKARSWEIEKFRVLSAKYQIFPIFIHAKYLVNLSAKNEEIRHLSLRSLIADLNFAQRIGAAGVIFHLHLGDRQILEKNIKKTLLSAPSSVFLILENSARTKLEEIGAIIRAIGDSRLKFCFDTAHAYQSGYNLASPKGLEEVFTVIRQEIGFANWVLVHANDSQTDLGTGCDRHADIGRGKIGPLSFFLLLNHPFSSTLPFIIETPGFKEEGLRGDRANLVNLKRLAGRRLGRDFFLQKTKKVAIQLLGKYLVVKRGENFQVGEIRETEAYVGLRDRASHAFRGRTERNKIMWEEGGRLYVYLIYGRHHCLNIVTEKRGYPSAVLIRSLKPIFGIRGETDGPGKICRELGITRKDTGLDIVKSGKILIKDLGIKPQRVVSAPRIGVDYAGLWRDKPLRFLSLDSERERG